MKRRWMWLGLLGLGLLGVRTLVVWAAEKEEKEQKVTMEQVPAKAREALLKLAGGAQITEVEKEIENGVEIYEAEWIADGVEHEAKVTADGKMVSEQDEEKEEQITMEQVPPQAREALMKAAGGAKILKVEKENEHGTVAYEAEWKVNGHGHELAVTAEGAMISTEETVEAKDVPEAVRQAAAKLFPGVEKLTFQKETKVIYEVSGIVGGKEKEIEISPGGRVHRHKEQEGVEGKDKGGAQK